MDNLGRVSRYFLNQLKIVTMLISQHTLLGIFATILIIEKFGRKKTMAVQFVIYAVCCSLLMICTYKYV